jgi:hypothetical protein
MDMPIRIGSAAFAIVGSISAQNNNSVEMARARPDELAMRMVLLLPLRRLAAPSFSAGVFSAMDRVGRFAALS